MFVYAAWCRPAIAIDAYFILLTNIVYFFLGLISGLCAILRAVQRNVFTGNTHG